MRRVGQGADTDSRDGDAGDPDRCRPRGINERAAGHLGDERNETSRGQDEADVDLCHFRVVKKTETNGPRAGLHIGDEEDEPIKAREGCARMVQWWLRPSGCRSGGGAGSSAVPSRRSDCRQSGVAVPRAEYISGIVLIRAVVRGCRARQDDHRLAVLICRHDFDLVASRFKGDTARSACPVAENAAIPVHGDLAAADARTRPKSMIAART